MTQDMAARIAPFRQRSFDPKCGSKKCNCLTTHIWHGPKRLILLHMRAIWIVSSRYILRMLVQSIFCWMWVFQTLKTELWTARKQPTPLILNIFCLLMWLGELSATWCQSSWLQELQQRWKFLHRVGLQKLLVWTLRLFGPDKFDSHVSPSLRFGANRRHNRQWNKYYTFL